MQRGEIYVAAGIAILSAVSAALRWFRRLRVQQEWRLATATVTSAEWRRDSNAEGGSAFVAIVRYEYGISEHVYSGTWTTPTGTAADADGYLASYPAGAELPIRYDPQHPSRSVPEVEVTPENFTALKI